MLHEGVHDPRRHDSPLHRPGDATGPTDGVDGAHVERVPALDPLAAARHAQRGAEDRGLEVVHCDGVAAAPTATGAPCCTRRGSVTTRSPCGWRTITQSIRGSRGGRHAPRTLT